MTPGAHLVRGSNRPGVMRAPTSPYAVLRWPDGSLYAGPFDTAGTFGTALLQASVVIVADRHTALYLAAFGVVRPVVEGDRATIPLPSPAKAT